MAFATVNYFSRSLAKASSFNVLFPDDPAIPRPYVDVLPAARPVGRPHHLDRGGRASSATSRGNLPIVLDDARRRPGLVHQCRRARLGLRRRPGQATSMGLVDRTFPVRRPSAPAVAIGGLSMGGYGAVKVGFKHNRQILPSVNSHSGALSASSTATSERCPKSLGPEFRPDLRPKDGEGGPDDPHRDRPEVPRPRPAAGDPDRLRRPPTSSSTRTESSIKHLDSTCTSPTSTRNSRGAHEWSYWDLTTSGEAIAFHAKNLKLARAK